jgi:hypothetical protein
MQAAHLSAIIVSLAALSSTAQAQSPGIDLQAGLGYARVFDGGGFSFAAAVDRPLSSAAGILQQALGVSFWYANTTIASDPSGPDGRSLVGLGARYQLGLRTCCRQLRPFLTVPVQLLRSSIPDRTGLAGADLLVSGIPELGAPRPLEDQVGSEWGWGAGLELGLRIGLGTQLSAQTSVQGLYQDIYRSSTRDGAWSWHAGLTYSLRPSGAR